MDQGVHKTFFVPWLPQEAFHLFTNCIGDWWPLETHSIAERSKGQRSTAVTVEPHEGGGVYETLSDGHTHLSFGKVKKYIPGQLLTLKWTAGCANGEETELEVIFSPAGTQTKIDLMQRGWETFGSRADEMKQRYETGWDFVLARYISFAKTHEAA